MIKDKLREALAQAFAAAIEAGELGSAPQPEIELLAPPDPRFGDFSTNLAMTAAGEQGRPPREVAAILLERLSGLDDIVEKAEIAGPGFINFHLKPTWLDEVVRAVHSLDDRYGGGAEGAGRRILIEFVSANPVGPLTVAQGRAAAIGDTLARLLEARGYDVSREYYVNDAASSTQIQKLAASLDARYGQALGQDKAVPEDGYQGEYLARMAQDIIEREGDRYLAMPEAERLAAFASVAERSFVEDHRRVLEAFGVTFDNWFRESSVFERGEVDEVLDLLKQRGYAYESEGALWLRSTAFGDDKDRALVRGNGKPTYIAADTAYHRNKFDRGFDRLIDIWGPDHHGYVARTKAATAALGYPADNLDIIIHQLVRLFSAGEMVRMSKRAGEIITLEEVTEEVGADAARYFFLMRSSDSPLDFDLELAKQETAENPVYYVQYAHARISSILRNAQEQGVALPDPAQADLSLLRESDELALMRKLADFPDEVSVAAQRYEPHRMTRYASELAGVFHVFYTNCRVLGDDAALTAARLTLVGAALITLRNVLRLLGVSAPESM
ncbi:MAG: arginine--tRNA ligase [Armatimonadota bacterium]|nr:MAG: arginine--tRNA ligase [Armatimonadota bacterium]